MDLQSATGRRGTNCYGKRGVTPAPPGQWKLPGQPKMFPGGEGSAPLGTGDQSIGAAGGPKSEPACGPGAIQPG